MSLRTRVIAASVLALVVTVAVLSLLTSTLLLRSYRGVVDEDLTRQLLHIEQEWANVAPKDASSATALIGDEPFSTRFVTYLLEPPGALIAASPGAAEIVDAIRDDPGVLSAAGLGALPVELKVGDTRLAAVRASLSDGGGLQVAVVASLDGPSEEALRIAVNVALAGLVCAVVGSAVTAVVLTRAVRPVQRVAEATRHIEAGELSAVPVPVRPREAQQLAVEVNALLQRIEAEQRKREQFLATISHEMRTPLAIAQGHLEVLQRFGATDPSIAVEAARAELRRASGLVDSVLTLARAAEPGFVRPEVVDLPELADDLALRLAGLDVAVDVQRPPECAVRLDAERLAQAVLNLVTNAMVHNAASQGRAVSVQIRFEVADEWLTVRVDDDGIGFTSENPADFLEPFISGLPGTSGLGLSVVDAVVRAHEGSVSLATSQFGGARVELHMPVVILTPAM